MWASRIRWLTLRPKIRLTSREKRSQLPSQNLYCSSARPENGQTHKALQILFSSNGCFLCLLCTCAVKWPWYPQISLPFFFLISSKLKLFRSFNILLLLDYYIYRLVLLASPLFWSMYCQSTELGHLLQNNQPSWWGCFMPWNLTVYQGCNGRYVE